jgi:hypothetical protein
MKFSKYQTRPIRFIEIYKVANWTLKIYSISSKNEYVPESYLTNAKKSIEKWLTHSEETSLETYNIASLMLHEYKEGCFAIINWWIDQNMLQHYVYRTENEASEEFKLFSSNGIVTCVWESAVIWFERNAWVKHILMKNDNPDFESYLSEQLNDDL